MKITDTLHIDESELDEQFIRASGPGGQNVNKVATAVQLRFRLSRNRSIPADAKARLLRIAGNKATNEGDILIEASAHRRQSANRDEARRRLAQMIRKSLLKPKKRVRTRPPRAAKERRLDEKKRRGLIKSRRQAPPEE